jgi:hypothetical protein
VHVISVLQQQCARVYSILCDIRSLIEPITEQEKLESTRRRTRLPKAKGARAEPY